MENTIANFIKERVDAYREVIEEHTGLEVDVDKAITTIYNALGRTEKDIEVELIETAAIEIHKWRIYEMYGDRLELVKINK